VNIQMCFLTAHFDLHFDPFIGNPIHIGFVLCRELLAQSVRFTRIIRPNGRIGGNVPGGSSKLRSVGSQ
jgi:hypothetical protein